MKQFKGFNAKEMTQAQRNEYIKRYYMSDCDTIRKFYRTPSNAKLMSEDFIKIRMSKANGHDYRILGGNDWEFSAGYIVGDETGVYLIVETHYNIYYVELER